MLDFASFSLGFVVAPVVYVILGAAAYSSFCAGKRLASLLRTQNHLNFETGPTAHFRTGGTTNIGVGYISTTLAS
jgi:hypothetical protein